MEFAVPGEPVRFCFVIGRGYNGAAEPRVVFLGFTATNEVACRWVSDTVRMLRVEGVQPLAPSVPVAKPQVGPKPRDSGEGDCPTEAVQ